MSGSDLSFERDYDLPVEIVWDALVDPDLVGGWLADATIDLRTGGAFDLTWLGPTYLAPTQGEIIDLAPFELLAIETSNIGAVTFELQSLEGGTRGGATRLFVRIVTNAEPRFAANIRAHWLTNLDQLEDLLRGHPVDWAHWERDRGAAWNAHFDGASRPSR
ncbi:MAG: SRPBCC domain-containing protein [Microbacteriaceae bacterium]